MAEAQSINSYTAVSVKPDGSEACEAVQNIAGKRFLCGEAPVLPLEACDRYGQCKCKYEKWDDRREEEERRFVIAGMAHQHYADGEKRSLRRGRRKSD